VVDVHYKTIFECVVGVLIILIMYHEVIKVHINGAITENPTLYYIVVNIEAIVMIVVSIPML